MKNKIKYLVIHCTATPVGRTVSKADILYWHTAPKSRGGRGWRKAGYSDMIHLDGGLENIIPFNQDEYVDPWEISNGAKGINGISRHVVYVGGVSTADSEAKKNQLVSKDTRTNKQKQSLEAYVKYMILRHPKIKILGHNQVSHKYCPSFDVPTWLRQIGVLEHHIYEST